MPKPRAMCLSLRFEGGLVSCVAAIEVLVFVSVRDALYRVKRGHAVSTETRTRNIERSEDHKLTAGGGGEGWCWLWAGTGAAGGCGEDAGC